MSYSVGEMKSSNNLKWHSLGGCTGSCWPVDRYVDEAREKLPPRDTGFGRQDFGSNQRQQPWQDQVTDENDASTAKN